MRKRKKVVVIGAGPGGLAAAILLAKSGVDVTVIERRSVPGGRTSTIESGGFRFDAGPTFFLYPRVLKEILEFAGRKLEDEIPMCRLDPHYKLVFGAGGELLATPDIASMEAAISRLSPGDGSRLRRFLADACVIDPTMAPEGMSTLYMLVPITHEHPNVCWPDQQARFRSLALRQLQKIGIKDIEQLSAMRSWSSSDRAGMECGVATFGNRPACAGPDLLPRVHFGH